MANLTCDPKDDVRLLSTLAADDPGCLEIDRELKEAREKARHIRVSGVLHVFNLFLLMMLYSPRSRLRVKFYYQSSNELAPQTSLGISASWWCCRATFKSR